MLLYFSQDSEVCFLNTNTIYIVNKKQLENLFVYIMRPSFESWVTVLGQQLI